MSLVTVLAVRKVISIARNIHIMGRREDPPEPTVIFTPEASEETVLAAWSPTASSYAYRLWLGVYAAECCGIHLRTHTHTARVLKGTLRADRAWHTADVTVIVVGHERSVP
jgi:hypothetical protein